VVNKPIVPLFTVRKTYRGTGTRSSQRCLQRC